MTISTRDLSHLPDIDALRRLLQSLAMLDAILSPQWESRLYSFNSRWSRGEQMGSMRNGMGDDFFALFNRHGCWLKGFAHEAPMSPYRKDGSRAIWPGVLDSVPDEFAHCLTQPAFNIEDTTFCIWRRSGDTQWKRGEIKFPTGRKDPDGSEYLLSPLDGDPKTYLAWAAGYYGLEASPGPLLPAVRHVYEHRPLTAEVVASLNPDLAPKDLAADIAEIAYPHRTRKK